MFSRDYRIQIGKDVFPYPEAFGKGHAHITNIEFPQLPSVSGRFVSRIVPDAHFQSCGIRICKRIRLEKVVVLGEAVEPFVPEILA